VPKLLAIAGKLRTLSRRLVTDAGGAPCCCGPGEVCPCDPALRLQSFRADTCRGGTTGPNVFDVSDQARIAIVRLEWGLLWDTLDFGPVVRVAESGESTGTAQWCVVHSPTGSTGLVWVLSGATSAFVYQRAGTNVESQQESVNYVGPDALIVPVPIPRGIGRSNKSVAWHPGNSLTWRAGPTYPNGQPVPSSPDFVALDGRCNQSSTFADRGIVETLQYAFAGGVDGGQAAYANTYRFANATSRVERNTQWLTRWTVRYLTCESGGPDQLTQEPGCSNCGDRATLEPFV